MTEWIPKSEKNDWKTAENKPVGTWIEFQKLKKVVAGRLAREGIEGGALLSSKSKADAHNPNGSSNTIFDVQPLPVDSDERNGNEEFDMEAIKRDLQKSFSQIEKSMEKKGLDIWGKIRQVSN